jgi:hypothetical protein
VQLASAQEQIARAFDSLEIERQTTSKISVPLPPCREKARFATGDGNGWCWRPSRCDVIPGLWPTITVASRLDAP